MKKYLCPICEKSVIEETNEDKKLVMKSGHVIKSKIIFLNDDGSVNLKCKHCDSIIKIPVKMELEK